MKTRIAKYVCNKAKSFFEELRFTPCSAGTFVHCPGKLFGNTLVAVFQMHAKVDTENPEKTYIEATLSEMEKIVAVVNTGNFLSLGQNDKLLTLFKSVPAAELIKGYQDLQETISAWQHKPSDDYRYYNVRVSPACRGREGIENDRAAAREAMMAAAARQAERSRGQRSAGFHGLSR